ncbi:hypothetical protein PFISCL1PPCAC_24726, partial [Pristionchus fissidentatus]
KKEKKKEVRFSISINIAAIFLSLLAIYVVLKGQQRRTEESAKASMSEEFVEFMGNLRNGSDFSANLEKNPVKTIEATFSNISDLSNIRNSSLTRIAGPNWGVEIHSTMEETTKYLDVNLVMDDAKESTSFMVFFKINLLPHNHMKRILTSGWTKSLIFGKPRTAWGMHLISFDNLLEESYEFVKNDSINISVDFILFPIH